MDHETTALLLDSAGLCCDAALWSRAKPVMLVSSVGRLQQWRVMVITEKGWCRSIKRHRMLQI